jgi:hypothetical protein
MKGFIDRSVAALCLAATVAGVGGCYTYRDLVDPCYPQRYEYLARQEVHAAFGPQVANGHVLDQTIWSEMFEPGTDKLTAAAQYQLGIIARRRPHPDPIVYLQTAQDVAYDPAAPEKLVEVRQDLDARRVVAIQKFLNAEGAGCNATWQVLVHNPSEVGLPAAAVASSYGQMVGTRFRGGLPGGGGASVTGGGGAVPR